MIWAFIKGIFSRYWPVIAGYLAIAGLVAGVLLSARKGGREAEKLEQIKTELKHAKTRSLIETRNAANSGDADDVRQRVRAQREKLKRSL